MVFRIGYNFLFEFVFGENDFENISIFYVFINDHDLKNQTLYFGYLKKLIKKYFF